MDLGGIMGFGSGTGLLILGFGVRPLAVACVVALYSGIRGSQDQSAVSFRRSLLLLLHSCCALDKVQSRF